MGDLITKLTPIDRSSRQKINTETQALNDKTDQRDLIDIFRMFYPKAKEYTFFQVHMEGSPEQITFWVTNQTLENLRKLKLYQASFPTTML